MKCWGYNGSGQLGQGNIINVGGLPNEMAGLASIVLGTGFGSLVVAVVVSAAAPGGVSAAGGVLSAVVSWSAPANNGGAGVTGYRIEVSTDSGVP